MFNIEVAAGDGDVDMRMLIELTTVSVQGTEYSHLDILFTGPLQHGAGGAAE